MSTKYYCDRCGIEATKRSGAVPAPPGTLVVLGDEITNAFKVITQVSERPPTQLDCCENCLRDLHMAIRKWWDDPPPF